jgi:predicted O-methyltransferase YrrM
MDNDLDLLKKELEELGEREQVPILRAAERDLLLAVAAEANPQKILEIGTAIGYSSLLLGERFKDAEIDTIEVDEKRYGLAQKVMERAGLAGRVHCHLGDAARIIPDLKGPYDFVFLDGPKGQYLRELKAIEPLLSEKAVIAADNVLFRGLVKAEGPVPHRYRTLVMRLREYIDYVTDRYETVIHEEGDGMAVSKKLGVRSEE